MIRNILRTAALVTASLAAALGFAVPAFAMGPVMVVPHQMFAVTDNGGVLVTHRALTAGQVVYSGGVAHIVGSAHGDIITLTPGLPASDKGKTVVFST